MKSKKYWRVDRYKWLNDHPYPKDGFDTLEQAQIWCAEITKVHSDRFYPEMQNGKWQVFQDVPT